MFKRKWLWLIPVIVALVAATGIFAAPSSMPGSDETPVALATGPVSVEEQPEQIENPSETTEADKVVALVLASDDFQSLSRSIEKDGLHFNASHHKAYLISECEGHRIYIVHFGFDPSPTGSMVGITAFVDVSAETILIIARVDQSSPDLEGLRTVTVETPSGDSAEFTTTTDIDPMGTLGIDWECWRDCMVWPPPPECLYICAACFAAPSPPTCGGCLICWGAMGIACAFACAT